MEPEMLRHKYRNKLQLAFNQVQVWSLTYKSLLKLLYFQRSKFCIPFNGEHITVTTELFS